MGVVTSACLVLHVQRCVLEMNDTGAYMKDISVLTNDTGAVIKDTSVRMKSTTVKMKGQHATNEEYKFTGEMHGCA